MPEKDEKDLNFTVGRIEGKLDTIMDFLKTDSQNQWSEINKVSSSLNKHKVKTAFIFGGLLTAWEFIKHAAKYLYEKGGH